MIIDGICLHIDEESFEHYLWSATDRQIGTKCINYTWNKFIILADFDLPCNAMKRAMRLHPFKI